MVLRETSLSCGWNLISPLVIKHLQSRFAVLPQPVVTGERTVLLRNSSSFRGVPSPFPKKGRKVGLITNALVSLCATGGIFLLGRAVLWSA